MVCDKVVCGRVVCVRVCVCASTLCKRVVCARVACAKVVCEKAGLLNEAVESGTFDSPKDVSWPVSASPRAQQGPLAHSPCCPTRLETERWPQAQNHVILDPWPTR